MQRSPVGIFLLRVLIWLPLIFGAWYLMAIVAAIPITFLVKSTLLTLFPDLINDVQRWGHDVQAVIAFIPIGSAAPKEAVAEIIVEVNVLMYAYCVPLYTALILATPVEEGVKWFRWIAGMLVLQITQTWGVSFDLLKSLLFDSGPMIAARLDFTQWQKEVVALCYQLGYLILPAVTPIALWVVLNRDFVYRLAPNIIPTEYDADNGGKDG